MELFKKEPDMICWNCDSFISHKKVKWEPRQVGAEGSTPLATKLLTDQMRKFEKALGNKKAIATPNHIFGLYEYEYRGKCPECDAMLTAFWFGNDSISKNKGRELHPNPFACHECKTILQRELQFWYSTRVVEEEKIKEYLLTVCPECDTQQAYPFEYNLEYGNID
ncbi:hypothetical protein NMT12_190025 [metagenome]